MTIYISGGGLAAAEARFLAGENALPCADGPACDEHSARLCADKHAASEFFHANDLPQPQAFPGGSEPYIVKPANGSGGRGIWSTEDFCEAGGGINAGFLVQEELSGPVFSSCLVGCGGRTSVCPPVRLLIDDRYDRCGAEYPVPAQEAALVDALARRVADALMPEGIVELKTVLSGGRAYILSLNEGPGALAATALHYGAGLDPLGALAALSNGSDAAFGDTPCRVSLKIDGRTAGTRGAADAAALERTADGAGDGRVTLRIETKF